MIQKLIKGAFKKLEIKTKFLILKQNFILKKEKLKKIARAEQLTSLLKRSKRFVSHLTLSAVFAGVLFLQTASSSDINKNRIITSPSPNVSKEEDTLNTQRAAFLYSVISKKADPKIQELIAKNKNLTVANNSFASNLSGIKTIVPNDRPKNTPSKYVVQEGDTLWSIARKFNITTNTLKWANGITDIDSVKPGQELVVLPTVGVLHEVAAGDTLESIASAYQSSVAMIVSQNNLEGQNLKVGMRLIIPDGVIYEPPPPEPEPAPSRTEIASTPSYSYPSVSWSPSYGSGNFPWGYCTWWVSQKRSIPWNGNAWEWYYNAQAFGYPTGQTPVPGSVLVTWESSVGHVAYVESVSGNTFTISEMNYYGYGVVNTRTLTTGQVPLIGFIY